MLRKIQPYTSLACLAIHPYNFPMPQGSALAFNAFGSSRSFMTSCRLRAPWDAIANNQFASGGLTVMATGLALAGLKQLLDVTLEHAKRRLLVRAEVDSRDDAYRWLMHWLSQHPQFSHASHVTVTTSLAAFGVSALNASMQTGGAADRKVLYLPAPGEHAVRHKGSWLWISRKRISNTQAAVNARLLAETLHITCLSRSRAPLEALIEDARAAYEAASRARTAVFSVGPDGYWQQAGARPVRPLRSVVLPGTQAQDLLADCTEFLSSEEWYAHHGIPYRRGYLLYGAPGTGKTSLVTALAGALGLDVYVVTLASPGLTDDTLRGLLNSAADRCILLLEDVDAAFIGRSQTSSTTFPTPLNTAASDSLANGASNGQLTAAVTQAAVPMAMHMPGVASSLSFSGLLNALDGVAAQEGRLLFMTTNHMERLAGALIRPGRVDYRLKFKLATSDQIRRLFVSFYRDMPHLELKGGIASQGLGKELTAEGNSGARLQSDGKLLVNSPASAVAMETPTAAVASAASSSISRTSGEESNTSSGQQMQRPASAGGTSSIAQATPTNAVPSQPVAAVVTGAQQQEQLLEQFADAFAACVPAGCVSMAALQGYLMQHKHDPGSAVQAAAEWMERTAACMRGSQEQ